MERTWRFWAEGGLATALALLAAATARPAILLGTAGIAAFLLARQYAFVRSLARTLDGLEVTYDVTPPTATVGEPVTIDVSVVVPPPSACDLTVEVAPPPSAELVDGDYHLTLGAGERSASESLVVEWSVAGTFQFGPTRLSARDPHGLHRETLDGEPGPRIRVDNRTPVAGRPRADAAGTPARSGAVDASDTARRIDWNATARLNRPHVREHQPDADRPLVVVVDHGAALGAGSAGETALDALRTAALGVVAGAEDRTDPVGLVTVDDGGISGTEPLRATAEGYTSVRRRLLEVEPAGAPGGVGTDDRGASRQPAQSQAAAVLGDDDSEFGRVLRPFFRAAATHVPDEDRRLFDATRRALRRSGTSARVVLLTDDGGRADLQRAVDFAGRQGSDVTVYIAPRDRFVAGETVARAAGPSGDLDAFLRALEGRSGVSVETVGPRVRGAG